MPSLLKTSADRIFNTELTEQNQRSLTADFRFQRFSFSAFQLFPRPHPRHPRNPCLAEGPACPPKARPARRRPGAGGRRRAQAGAVKFRSQVSALSALLCDLCVKRLGLCFLGTWSLILVPWYLGFGIWDLGFGIWDFARVAAQPQTTKPF